VRSFDSPCALNRSQRYVLCVMSDALNPGRASELVAMNCGMQAMDMFYSDLQEKLRRTVWSTGCKNWYVNRTQASKEGGHHARLFYCCLLHEGTSMSRARWSTTGLPVALNIGGPRGLRSTNCVKHTTSNDGSPLLASECHRANV